MKFDHNRPQIKPPARKNKIVLQTHMEFELTAKRVTSLQFVFSKEKQAIISGVSVTYDDIGKLSYILTLY